MRWLSRPLISLRLSLRIDLEEKKMLSDNAKAMGFALGQITDVQRACRWA